MNIYALANDALNAACAFIQDALQISDGGGAGLFFTGETEAAILKALSDYIEFELTLKEDTHD